MKTLIWELPWLRLCLIFWSALSPLVVFADKGKVYHVSVVGSDRNVGTLDRPFKTINHAAQFVKAGDVVTVHSGIYREQVVPLNGGVSDSKRITYQAAEGEKVEVKGSEIIKCWKLLSSGIWKVTIPDTFFGAYNPFKDEIKGDWFFPPNGRNLHTGEVYLNGKALQEAGSVDEVSKNSGSWYSSNTDGMTTLFANFSRYDPARHMVEINVRPSCFYPARTGINYITVKGFHFSQAATQWAAPTAEQVGMIGTNWSKGWIIEGNVVSDSKCVGITLGKDRTSGHNIWSANPALDGSMLYNHMVERVIADGWSREKIGSHIVRSNTIFNCGAAGICGSFGAAFSQISGNHIYNIYTYRPFWGAEMGGIKIHGAVDVLISGNRVHNTNIGIWLDWMAQGTRVSGNLVYGNDYVDFFPEVNHGPYLVDNNLFLSAFAIKDWSEGGAFAHNLIAGLVSRAPQERLTPYFLPHSTALVAVKPIQGGDNRFYNNIFVGNAGKLYEKSSGTYLPPDAVDRDSGYGLGMYDNALLPVVADGNVYLNGALNFKDELNLRIAEDFDSRISLTSLEAGVYVNVSLPKLTGGYRSKLVTTGLLGRAAIPAQRFENPDGSPLVINTDYLGRNRNEKDPIPGPFEDLVPGKQKIKVW